MKSFVLTCGLLLGIAVQHASAEPTFRSLIPNGNVNSCNTCHTDPPDLNAFGTDFLNNNFSWSASLAALDSDGDGYSNGQELGNPGGTIDPIPGASISLPGDTGSIPALRPPSIAITNPTNGASVPAPFTGPITATTTNPLASITRVQFYSGATLLGSMTASPFSLAVNLGAGTYTLTAKAIDYLNVTNVSQPVTITVNSGGAAPVITTPPLSQTVPAGANVSFSVVATGTAPLRYQWRMNGNSLAGQTNSLLTLTNVQPTNAGAYSVVVSNSTGTATSPTAALVVQVPPANVTAAWANGRTTVSFETLNGLRYRLEYLDNLSNTNWTVLPGEIIGTGTVQAIVDPSATVPSRFYRVRAE